MSPTSHDLITGAACQRWTAEDADFRTRLEQRLAQQHDE